MAVGEEPQSWEVVFLEPPFVGVAFWEAVSWEVASVVVQFWEVASSEAVSSVEAVSIHLRCIHYSNHQYRDKLKLNHRLLQHSEVDTHC